MDGDSFIGMRLKNAERSLARRLKREKAKKVLFRTLDSVTMPTGAGDDIPVRRLPPSVVVTTKDFYTRLQLRDVVRTHAELWDETEMKIADLFLQGHTPLAAFRAVGVSPSSGYRKYGRMLAMLKEACHE